MADTRGLVIHAAPDGWAEVIVDRKSACGGCADTHKCRSCLSATKITTRVLNPANATDGDLVVVSMKSEIVLKGAAVAYIIPVVGLMVGAFSGSTVYAALRIDETTAAILLSFLGLGCGFVVSTFISKLLAAKKKFIPVISRVVNTFPNHRPGRHR